ncbi:hypothetical protein [Aeromonas rivipollensis]|uniref:hypothetical protein n=1 Tax=Aeromonas rivipollensis TaxID=948519 RepID=UPI001331B212|nr:hypothetical protein [Aeromonas rivipollensis]
MKEYAVVRTKEQLKQALDSETRNIIVVDEGLARNIKVVKYASKAGLVLAVGSAGVAATNFWNPVGLTVGLVGAVSSGTLITAIIALGVGATFIWAIYNNYSIKVKGKYTSSDGDTYEGEIILERD